MLSEFIQLVVPRRIRSLPFFAFAFTSVILFVLVLVWHRQDTAVYSPYVEETVEQTTSQPINYFVSSLCNCDKESSAEEVSQDAFDWCGPESSARGKHQKVITYSLYGNANSTSIFKRYYSLLRNISLTAEKVYPGFIIRIYHNISESDEAYSQLCDVYCRSSNVDLCSLPDLMGRVNSTASIIDAAHIGNLNPRMFRFLVMFDPNVDVFISRDVDSLIWPREVDAVDEWLSTNYTFHVMRDHKVQISIMLAGTSQLGEITNIMISFKISDDTGMWGAKIHLHRDTMKELIKALVMSGQNQIKWQDQISLESVVWPVAKNDVVLYTIHLADIISEK